MTRPQPDRDPAVAARRRRRRRPDPPYRAVPRVRRPLPPWRGSAGSWTAGWSQVPCCPPHARPDHHLAGQRPTQVPGGPAPSTRARGGRDHPHRGVRRAEPGPGRRRGAADRVLLPRADAAPRRPARRRDPRPRARVGDPAAGPGGVREGRLPRGPRRVPRRGRRGDPHLRRPDRGCRPAGAALPGRREAGQPRRDAAHRRRGRRRGRHRGRPGDRLGQPQPGPRQQGHGVLRAGRHRLHRGDAAVAARPRHHPGGHDPGHRPGLHRRRLHRPGRGRRRRREVRPDRRGARRRRSARSGSRWPAAPTPSTSPRRRPSSSTRRCASAVAADPPDRGGERRFGPQSRPPSRGPPAPWHDVRHASGPRLICSRERRAEGDRRAPVQADRRDTGRWWGPPAVRHPQRHLPAVAPALRRGRRGARPPRVRQGAVRPGGPGPLRGRRRLARLGRLRRRPVRGRAAPRPRGRRGQPAPSRRRRCCRGASSASRA